MACFAALWLAVESYLLLRFAIGHVLSLASLVPLLLVAATSCTVAYILEQWVHPFVV